jgi:superfamily II DNA/RNA helicase
LELLSTLVDAIGDSDGTLLFTQTTNAADLAAQKLREFGVNAQAIHSKLDDATRTYHLHSFSEGNLKAVVAPLVLDEGVDVPAADFAVILAASRQRRQMVQRMGRVLRRKDDGRQARFAITFVAGTTEDPERGAHETFLDEILDVAEEVHAFPLGAPMASLREYLRPDRDGSTRVGHDRSRAISGVRAPEVTTGPSQAMAHGSKAAAKRQRDLVVSQQLGISVEQLIAYRKLRAERLTGTKGMSASARVRLLARSCGVTEDFVERWDAAERSLER